MAEEMKWKLIPHRAKENDKHRSARVPLAELSKDLYPAAPKAKRIPRMTKNKGHVLNDAITALNCNADFVMDSKTGFLKSTTYPPEILATMRGMFASRRVYLFQMHASQTLATIGGGVFNTKVDWSPSVSSFAEWTALSALFDEVVLRKSTLKITSAFGPTSTAIIFQVAVAPDPSGISGTTPTYTPVLRLAESEVIHPYNLGSSKTGSWLKATNIPKSRPWALTSSPTGASGQGENGCFGQWSLASNIVGTATTNYFFAALYNVVALRSRA
jgi:hypothetical protein